MITRVKTPAEIEAMRESGRMLSSVLEKVESEVAAGMSTKDLAELAKKYLKPLGGQPAFLGYQGFPDVLCVSVNDEIVHGIPRKNHILRDGDLVSMDFGVRYKGMVTDSATTVIVGSGSKESAKLVDTTRESLEAGILAVKDGATVGDIGAAVEEILAKHKYGIVRDLVGHGVGHELHEDPNIPNFGKKGKGFRFETGMTIAIEPMATTGTHKVVVDHDGWTIRSQDHSLAAHFEHTVLVTDDGAEVLTRRKTE